MNENNRSFIDDGTIEKAENYRQRKITSVLTIVFTDIAQSTYLREQLGEVAYEEQREEHDDTIQEIIEGDDAGAVLKSTGDGALAVFSEPSTAVERCLNIQRNMAAHRYFKLRIGIDMGQVSLKSQGGIVKDVFGRHVNRAARIQALAEPGHILTSFHIFDCAVGWLKRSNISWHNHGLTELKGFAEPVSIHEAYNPLHFTPQSNDSFPKPFTEDVRLSVARTRYLPVNAQEWEQLLESLRDNPIEIVPPKSISSDDPFSSYSNSIAWKTSRLNELIPTLTSILWVDDFPDNNMNGHRILKNAGCKLDLALTTEEAQNHFQNKKYVLSITNMGQGDNMTAGIDLLRWIKDQHICMPTFVYTSNRAISLYAEQAIDEGASLATAGLITLLDGIDQVLSELLFRMPFEYVDESEESLRKIKRSIFREKLGKLFHLS